MAKLSDKDRIMVLKDYAAGKSAREIARKFDVSATAISKILNKAKSLHDEKESLQKFTKQNNAEIAQIVIDDAMNLLKMKVKSASVSDLIKVIERLTVLYKDNSNEMSALDKIVISLNKLAEVKNNDNIEWKTSVV